MLVGWRGDPATPPPPAAASTPIWRCAVHVTAVTAPRQGRVDGLTSRRLISMVKGALPECSTNGNPHLSGIVLPLPGRVRGGGLVGSPVCRKSLHNKVMELSVTPRTSLRTGSGSKHVVPRGVSVLRRLHISCVCVALSLVGEVGLPTSPTSAPAFLKIPGAETLAFLLGDH